MKSTIEVLRQIYNKYAVRSEVSGDAKIPTNGLFFCQIKEELGAGLWVELKDFPQGSSWKGATLSVYNPAVKTGKNGDEMGQVHFVFVANENEPSNTRSLYFQVEPADHTRHKEIIHTWVGVFQTMLADARRLEMGQ